MSTINETAYKAADGSPDKGVPYIYWINLGENLTIKPGETYQLTNTLGNTGYTFHMTIKGVGNMNLVSNSLPTEYGDLGRIDYQGIQGYPVFYPYNYSYNDLNVWRVDLEDIYITDSDGNTITNYSFVAADAEQTNLFPYGAESNTFVTSNGVWSLYDTVKADPTPPWIYPGELELIGLGSNTVQELPVKEGYNYAPIFLCQATGNCQITMISPHQRQAVAIGVMIQEQGISIEKSPLDQIIIKRNNYEFFFDFKFTALTSTVGYTEYRISDSLHPGLSANLESTTVTQTMGGVTTNVTFKTQIVNNTTNIIIPIDNVTEGADVTIRLYVKVTNRLLLPDKFFNECSIAVLNTNSNENKVALSNKVTVISNPDFDGIPKTKPISPANPKPTPIVRPNPHYHVISHCSLWYYWYCCCKKKHHKKHNI